MKKFVLIPVVLMMLMTQGCVAGEPSNTDNTTAPVQTENENSKSTFVAADKLAFRFPNDWKLNDKENAFDLQCFSAKEDLTTGVFVYDKMDIAEGGSSEDIFNLQIENVQSKRENFKLVQETKDNDTGDKRIKTVVYSGEKDSVKDYYIFSLVEFKDFEKFAIIIQTCIPSGFEKNLSTLDEIVSSCAPVQS